METFLRQNINLPLKDITYFNLLIADKTTNIVDKNVKPVSSKNN